MEMQKSCEVTYSKYGIIRIPSFWRHAGRVTGYFTLPWSRVLRYATFCYPRIPPWLNAICIGLVVVCCFAGRAAWNKSQANKLTNAMQQDTSWEGNNFYQNTKRDRGESYFERYNRHGSSPWLREINMNRRAFVLTNRIGAGHTSLEASLNRFNFVSTAECECGANGGTYLLGL
jgi:hypothetical protein